MSSIETVVILSPRQTASERPHFDLPHELRALFYLTAEDHLNAGQGASPYAQEPGPATAYYAAATANYAAASCASVASTLAAACSFSQAAKAFTDAEFDFDGGWTM